MTPTTPGANIQAISTEVNTPAEDEFETPADDPTPTLTAKVQVPSHTEAEGHTMDTELKTPAATPTEVKPPTDDKVATSKAKSPVPAEIMVEKTPTTPGAQLERPGEALHREPPIPAAPTEAKGHTVPTAPTENKAPTTPEEDQNPPTTAVAPPAAG